MPDPTLLVPIRVSALCVGAPDAQQALGQPPMADFAHLPYATGGTVHNRGPYTAGRATAAAAPFKGAAELPAGVHLHWSLPEGLSHAVASGPGEGSRFPAVPSRWMVVRVAVDAQGGYTTASWVVESDRLSVSATVPPGMAQPTVPWGAQPGQGFRYLGQAFDAATWAESSTSVDRLSPLTAVGYGEPTFASYYPNCSSVFGFHDPMSGYTAGTTLTYYVAGWYGDVGDDPLSAGGVAPGDNPYGWTWTGGETPTRTLCTGAVGDFAWSSGTAYLSRAPSALTAAVAASPQEALSALMADALAAAYPDQDFSSAEPLLNALQFGLLARPVTPDSLEAFEEAVHAAGFGALDGGVVWSVVPADSSGDAGEGSEATLPAGQGAMLDSLNDLEYRLSDLGRELAGRRQQLFVDWQKYLVTAYEPLRAPPTLRVRLTDVMAYVEDEVAAITAIAGLGGAMDTLQAQVDAASATLAAVLDPSLRLARTALAPRFHRPADPVLVLSGADVAPRGHPRTLGESGGFLRCRTASQLVTRLTVADGLLPGSAAESVSASQMPAVPVQPSTVPSDAFQGAFADAFFLNPGLQARVAKLVDYPGGSTNPAHMDFAATEAALRAAAAAFVAGKTPQGVAYDGDPSAPRAVSGWTGTPWEPLLLEYDVSFGPVQEVLPSGGTFQYPPDYLLQDFAFDEDSIDLVYQGAAPTAGQRYVGSAVLSAGAATDLAGALRRWIAGTGSDDPRVAEALDAVTRMPLLAQGMAGMGAEMTMRRQALQMTVSDPLAPEPVQAFVARVRDAVGDETAFSPLPEVSFNPVRAGTLSVVRLRLLDTFGRTMEYTAPRVVVARGLVPEPELGLPSGTAFLPPRVVQPSRLLFRWMSAAGAAESTAVPATSPVLGWVIPDYLDRSLALYSSEGAPLGTLGLSADGATVLWVAAPGGGWPLGTPLSTVMAGQDAELAAFARALQEGGAAYFAPFFQAVRDALAFSLPERFREGVGTAVLLGQPLALARASLTLSLDGPPPADASWASFTAAVLGSESLPTAPDGGLTQLRVPVRLGAPGRLGDTLVGYWTAPGGSTDWASFYAPAASSWDGPVGPPSLDTVTLAPRADSAADAVVTMLLDPRGAVHATTGLLPVDAVSLPPSQYADAMRQLAVAFAAGPVLSGSNAPAEGDGPPPMTLVRPRVASGAWTWVTVDRGAWASVPLDDAPSAAGTLSYSPQRVSDGWMVLTGPGTSSSS